MRPRKYSEEDIKRAIELSSSFKEANEKLGSTNPKRSYWLSKRTRELSIDTSHFGPKLKYTKEILEKAVIECKNFTQVMRYFGLKWNGESSSYLAERIRLFEIDISHFKREASNKGKPAHHRRTAKDILLISKTGRREKPELLRRALKELGVEEKCGKCMLETSWYGKFLRLEIDHIDGNSLNNVKENLRFLCPNCHSQTDTFKSKNI